VVYDTVPSAFLAATCSGVSCTVTSALSRSGKASVFWMKMSAGGGIVPARLVVPSALPSTFRDVAIRVEARVVAARARTAIISERARCFLLRRLQWLICIVLLEVT
jgi:hypothetical protein